MSQELSNTARASVLVARELIEMAAEIPEADRESYFDGRNRDMWMDAFIARLKSRYQQPDRIASND